MGREKDRKRHRRQRKVRKLRALKVRLMNTSDAKKRQEIIDKIIRITKIPPKDIPTG